MISAVSFSDSMAKHLLIQEDKSYLHITSDSLGFSIAVALSVFLSKNIAVKILNSSSGYLDSVYGLAL